MNPDAAKTIPNAYVGQTGPGEHIREYYREQGRVEEQLRILDILTENLPAVMLTEIRKQIKE